MVYYAGESWNIKYQARFVSPLWGSGKQSETHKQTASNPDLNDTARDRSDDTNDKLFGESTTKLSQWFRRGHKRVEYLHANHCDEETSRQGEDGGLLLSLMQRLGLHILPDFG